MHPVPLGRPDTCQLIDPDTVDRDDHDVVEPVLTHMAAAASSAFRVAARNPAYRADHAVNALADTTAAVAALTVQMIGYVADTWPGASSAVAGAAMHLDAARSALATARDHVNLYPAADIHLGLGSDSDDTVTVDEAIIASAAPV